MTDSGTTTLHTRAALEQAILDQPDSRAAWQVYADWLLAHGDVWGERVALSLSDAKTTLDLQQALALDEEQRSKLFGRLAILMERPDFGEVAAELEWAHGFVVGVRLVTPESGWRGTAPDTILAALLESPAGRLLRRITITLSQFEHDWIGKCVDAIARGGVRPGVRDLMLGEFEYDDEREISRLHIGDIAPALRVLPNLRRLWLRGSGIELGDALELPALENLMIQTGGLPADAVRAIGRARLPNLQRMQVWFGDSRYGARGDIDLLMPLFHGDGVPKLRQLRLMNCEFADDIVMALADAPLLAQLEVLDLSKGALRNRGARAILDAAARFGQLATLDLDHNYLSAEMAEALEQALGSKVVVGQSLAGSDGYYVAVGE
jgi:uncharacterized protein (TIGR02996 family)